MATRHNIVMRSGTEMYPTIVSASGHEEPTIIIEQEDDNIIVNVDRLEDFITALLLVKIELESKKGK